MMPALPSRCQSGPPVRRAALVKIGAFRPLRYNPEKISFISRVVAPPFDVIDPAMARELRVRDHIT
jgi:hypothetical protein